MYTAYTCTRPTLASPEAYFVRCKVYLSVFVGAQFTPLIQYIHTYLPTYQHVYVYT